MPPRSSACCAHNHDCEVLECGPAYSLYKHIDLSHVRCLNEEVPGSCANVFRPWAERLRPADVPLRSHVEDPELLLHIPFDGAVKLKAICVIGGPEGAGPATLKVYTNRDDVDFSNVEQLPVTQQWDLQRDNPGGQLEYPTQLTKFNGVHCLDLLFTGNFGADATEIHYIGLKGEFSERKRQAVEAVYELRALPSDHKVPGTELGAHHGL